MSKIIVACFMICFLVGIIAYGEGYKQADEDLNIDINYSYCIENEYSVEIVDIYFKNHGRDRVKDRIYYNFRDSVDCYVLALSSFTDAPPLFIQNSDNGCKIKQEMLERCKLKNENS
jgi:hypothetical protein